MGAVLRTLREIAAGMAFLHSKDVLHCDLTGAQESGSSRRAAPGWMASLAALQRACCVPPSPPPSLQSQR